MVGIIVILFEYCITLLSISGVCYCVYKIYRCDFFCIRPEERVEWIQLKHNLTKNSPRYGRGRKVTKVIIDLDILINKTNTLMLKKFIGKHDLVY